MKFLLPLLSLTTLILGEPVLLPRQRGCPQCIPWPEQNQCDIFSSCVTLGSAHPGPGDPPEYCACRAGYKAGSDNSVQWRLPWAGQEGRVFVTPGVACNTLCEHWELGPMGCQEVPLRAACM